MNYRTFRVFVATLVGTLIFSCAPKEKDSSSWEYLKTMKKIDVHTHVNNDAEFLSDFMDEYNFKFVNITSVRRGGAGQPAGEKFSKKDPRHYAWTTKIHMEGLFEEDWAERAIKLLDQDFKNGAVGVKFWKDIGMRIKKPDDTYLQLDDSMFIPVFEFIASQDKTVIAHMGDPIQAWMGSPWSYFGKNPHFNLYNKPHMPSYNDIMAARDNVLVRHPDLRFVGAHLGSLEFDVAEIAFRLDRYPNFAVELGGKMRHLAWQNPNKVRAFMIKYQDRIMYGTDKGTPREMTPEYEAELKEGILYRNDLFSKYLATDAEIPWANIITGDKPVPGPAYTVRGISLPREVLEQIYYHSAIKWFPGVEKEY